MNLSLILPELCRGDDEETEMKQVSYLPEVTLGCVLFIPVPHGLEGKFFTERASQVA